MIKIHTISHRCKHKNKHLLLMLFFLNNHSRLDVNLRYFRNTTKIFFIYQYQVHESISATTVGQTFIRMRTYRSVKWCKILPTVTICCLSTCVIYSSRGRLPGTVSRWCHNTVIVSRGKSFFSFFWCGPSSCLSLKTVKFTSLDSALGGASSVSP